MRTASSCAASKRPSGEGGMRGIIQALSAISGSKKASDPQRLLFLPRGHRRPPPPPTPPLRRSRANPSLPRGTPAAS
eukprot:4071287-Pyramimonas_sp.AAC.1